MEIKSQPKKQPLVSIITVNYNQSPVLCATTTLQKRTTDYQLNTILKFDIWVTRLNFAACLYAKRRIKARV